MEIAEAIPLKKALVISNVIRITLDFREIFLSLGGTALALSLIRLMLDWPPKYLVITGFCSVVLVIKGVSIIRKPNRQNDPDDSGFSRIEFCNGRERKWNIVIRRALHLGVPEKADWKTHVHLNLIDADCSNIGLITPYVIFKFRIENYLPVPLFFEIVSEGGGTIGARWLDADLNLPALPQVLNVYVREYSPQTFEIRLDIPSLELKAFLVTAEKNQRSVQWLIWGHWYAEVYGSRHKVWDTSSTLSCESVPRIDK